MMIEYMIETQGSVENYTFTFNTKDIGFWHFKKIPRDIAVNLLKFLRVRNFYKLQHFINFDKF